MEEKTALDVLVETCTDDRVKRLAIKELNSLRILRRMEDLLDAEDLHSLASYYKHLARVKEAEED